MLAGRIISGLAFQAMGPYNEDIDIIIGGKRDCRTGPRKGWYVDMSGAKKRPPMEPITVRFSPKAMQALGQIADDNCLSKAQVVRLATDGKLYQYLRDIRIISPADADAIREEIRELFNATRRVEYELHKMGVNLNQVARALNIMVKNGQPWPREAAEISLTPEHIMGILLRYEQASEKAGEALCHILA